MLMNEKVKHIVFGDGKVVNQEAQRITVQFSEQYGTKKFVYPNVFGKYLELYDANLGAAVIQELQSKLIQIKDEEEKTQLLYEENKVNEKLKLEIEKKNATKKRNATKNSKAK